MSPSNEDLWISVIRLKFWKCFVPGVHTCLINLLTSDRSFLLQGWRKGRTGWPLWRTSNCKLRNAKVSRGWRAIRPSTVSKTCSNLSTSVCDKWRILSTLLPVTRYLEFVTVHHYAWRATMKNYRVERIHRANEKLSIHNFVNVKVFILKLWKKYDSVLFFFFFPWINFTGIN